MTYVREVPTQFGPFRFNSQKEAAEHFGVSIYTIQRAVNSPDPIIHLGISLIRTLQQAGSPQVTYTLAVDYFQQQLDYAVKQAEERLSSGRKPS